MTISGSAVPFISPGASIRIGVKDKAVHLGFGNGDDYMGTLLTIRERYFVFCETEEKRAWLIDGASAVLHLLRAYLKFYLGDAAVSVYFKYSDGDITEASYGTAYMGAAAAFEVLAHPSNQILPIYPKNSVETEERTVTLGTKRKEDVTILKSTTSNFTLKERVDQICQALLQITAYYDDLSTTSGYGFRVLNSPRRTLEGFE